MIGHVATLSPDSPASFFSGPLPDAQDSSTDQINVDPVEPISSSGQDIHSSSSPDGTVLQSWKDLVDSILDSKVDNTTNDQSSTTPLLQSAQPQSHSDASNPSFYPNHSLSHVSLSSIPASSPSFHVASNSSSTHVTPVPRLPAIPLTDLSEWVDFSIPKIPPPEVEYTNQRSKIPIRDPRWKIAPSERPVPHMAPISSDSLPASDLPSELRMPVPHLPTLSDPLPTSDSLFELHTPVTPLAHPVSLPASVPTESLRLPPDRMSAPEMINRGAIPVSVLNKMLESPNDDIFAAAGGIPSLQGLLKHSPPKDVERLRQQNAGNLVSGALDRTAVDVSNCPKEDETHGCRCVIQ